MTILGWQAAYSNQGSSRSGIVEHVLSANVSQSEAREAGSGYGIDSVPQSEKAPETAPAKYMNRMTVKAGDKIVLVPVRDILWIQSHGNLLQLHLPTASFEHRMTIKDIYRRLDPERFLRVHRNAVVNLDNYRPVVETAVHFGFNKDNLTKDAKDAIDQLAASVATTKGYIITVEGATDSIGSSDYNYDLSQRRANAVIQYLAAEKSVPAYKIYLIGLGKDKPVDSNKTADGRAKNRRVDIRLMTNTGNDTTTPAQAPTSNPSPTANANPPSM